MAPKKDMCPPKTFLKKRKKENIPTLVMETKGAAIKKSKTGTDSSVMLLKTTTTNKASGLLSHRQLVENEDGSLKKKGDVLKNPKIADTLERIADDPFTFYNGSLAEDIVEDIKEQGTQVRC